MNNPTKDEKSRYRVSRGGSWSFNARYSRVSDRYYYFPDGEGNRIGFRVVRNKA